MQVPPPTGQVTSGAGEEGGEEKKEGLAIPLKSHPVIKTKIYS